MYFKDISKNFKIMSRVVSVRKQSLTIIIATVIFALLEDCSARLNKQFIRATTQLKMYCLY